jgi:hypothetical protein
MLGRRRFAEDDPAVNYLDGLADLRRKSLVLRLGNKQARRIRSPRGEGSRRVPPEFDSSLRCAAYRPRMRLDPGWRCAEGGRSADLND